MKLLPGAVVAGVLFLTFGVRAEAQPISWRTDLVSAATEAKQTGKVLMVDVYTDWCEWCRVLDTRTYTDAKVIAGLQQFVTLKLNPEKGEAGAQFARKYAVTGYPTILFIDGDGNLESRIDGYEDAQSFNASLTRTVEEGPKIKPYLAEFNAGTYDNSSRLVTMLLDLGRGTEAAPVFDRLRTATTLPVAFQESTALALAGDFLDNDEYDRGLSYIKVVEDTGSGSDSVWQAHRLRAIVLYSTRGKTAALSYLDTLQAGTGTPAEWKDRYADLEKRMKAAKDSSGS